MIEVNLHPYGKKGASRGAGFDVGKLLGALKSIGGGGGAGGLPGDPYVIFAAAAGVVSLTVIAFMFLGVRSDMEEVQVRLQEELDEYARFQEMIERNDALLARRDSIAERVAVIQEIDAGRFTGAHVMDEVALALPDYTWLTEVVWVQDDPTQYRVSGRAGQMFDVTQFLARLEASRFLRDVSLEGSTQAPNPDNPEDIVYTFTMLLTYEQPPLDELETVPLFQTQAAQAAPDSIGGS